LNQKALAVISIVIAGISAAAVISSPYLNYALDNQRSNKPIIENSEPAIISPQNDNDSQFVPKNQVLSSRNSQDALATAQEDLTSVQLFERTQRSVVQIADSSSQSDPSESRLGSGFVYDELGHIITNYHVVMGGEGVHVTFPDGTIYRAKLIGADPYTDLAVLQVSDALKDKLVPVVMSNSTQLVVGQQIAAIGNPFGLSGSMTTGIVSGLGRLIPAQVQSSDGSSTPFSVPDIIQTDASINPGNSGGPLLNMKGEVIGINSAIFSTTGTFAGVGFAIPSNTITKIVPSLISTGSFTHPWLGVSGTNMNPDIAGALGLEVPRGFLVVDVVAGSPAEKAGIKGGDEPTTIDGREIPLGGDVITKFDGRDVRKIDDILVYLQREKAVGDSITLTVIRDGETQDINLILGERPNAATSP
jgi:S1-C subfamily serine protease